MRPPRAGLMRDTLGSLCVLGIVAVTAFGLPVIDHLLPSVRALPAAVTPATPPPFAVGGGVSVVPPPAAQLDVSKTRTGSDRGSALFLAGGVRLAVVVTPYRGSLADAATRLRNKLLRAAERNFPGDLAAQVEPDGPIRSGQDVAGRLGTYTTSGRPGTYAVFVNDGRSVEVTASGPESDLRGLDLERVIQSIWFGQPERGGP